MDFDDIWQRFDALKLKDPDPDPGPEKTDTCKNCESSKLAEDKMQGDLVCMDCGCVQMERIIDEKAEWNFGQDESAFSKDPSRCGCPQNPLLAKSSMSTMMVNANFKNHGNIKRLHQQQSMDYVERSRYHVFEDITRMAMDNGRLPTSIVELAKCYYTTLSQKRLSRGLVRKGLIACCIYYACKKNHVSRSVKEVADMCGVAASTINKTIKIFRDVMNDDVGSMLSENTDVSDLYCRFANKLCLGRCEESALIRCTRKVSNNVEKGCLLNGKTPTAVTASIIYFCCEHLGLKVTKKQVIDVNNVSSVTLNKLMIILKGHAEEILA